jgi:hypothetical protein
LRISLAGAPEPNRHEHRDRDERVERCAIAALSPNGKGQRWQRANPNMRTLQGMKSNYGVPGRKIDLEWKNGIFVPANGPTGLDKMAAEAKVDDAFIAILKKFTAQNRTCSPNPGPTYAPVMLAAEPEAKGSTKAAFALAMSRQLSANAIHVEGTGPPSRRRTKLALGETPK